MNLVRKTILLGISLSIVCLSSMMMLYSEAYVRSPEQILSTDYFGFGFPLNAFEMKATYHPIDPSTDSKKHILLTFRNWSYLNGVRFSKNSNLYFNADGHVIPVGEAVAYHLIGLNRNRVEEIQYELPLETLTELTRANHLEGHIGNHMFQFNPRRQLEPLKSFAELCQHP